MLIMHVVMIAFKEDVPADEITAACKRLLGLKQQCIHPTTNAPYVKLAMGGKQNSTEGLDGGITHVFGIEFENEEDRTYYLEKDPAHREFVESAKPLLSKIQVVDFCPGVF